MSESNLSSGISSNNASYVTSEVIAERLDTSRLINAIKSMLEGKVIIPRPNRETGVIDYVVIAEGTPLMNEKGIQMTMMACNMVFSPFFAQGFLTRDDYDRIVFELDVNLSDDIMANLYEWGVDIFNYGVIINNIVHLSQGYMSQAIDGHLTNSITQSVRFVESNTLKERGGFPNPFSRGGN